MNLKGLLSNNFLYKSKAIEFVLFLTQILLGSIVLGLISQVAFPLPFSPVPISLQTFGIAALTAILGFKKAPWAILLYLSQATIGLPVLAGGAVNPLWMIGPKAGYLIGFFVASLILGYLLKEYKNRSFLKTWVLFFCSEVTILTLGTIWLGFFVGWENTFLMGCLPFIPGAFLKTTMVTSGYKFLNKNR